MKMIDIAPPENLSSQFRFHCADMEGGLVSPGIADALLDFTPSGNFSSQHVGIRIITCGYFPDSYGTRQYFVMFSTLGTEADCLNRQGLIWSSAVVNEDKRELITHFLKACQTNQLLELFPCLEKLSDSALHSAPHLLGEFTQSDFQQVKHLTGQLKASQPVTLSTSGVFVDIYQSTERLIFNSFRFRDLVGCSFNGIPDSIFDVCIVNGKRNSLTVYTSNHDSQIDQIFDWFINQPILFRLCILIALFVICLAFIRNHL